jgi:molybdopterin-guanine dinucleotide biosynthesis protein A
MTKDARLLVGVFVGGRGSRMGGVAKGLLKVPDSEMTLLERLLGELARAAPGAEVVLVGDATSYAAAGLRGVDDAPRGVGPLGGLLGLLLDAEQRGAELVLALACDLPRIDAALLTRLLNEAVTASALVAAQDGVRNPLVARYQVAAALPAARGALQAGERSLQAVLDRLAAGVRTLPLTAAEAARLDDWDSPEDVQRGGYSG